VRIAELAAATDAPEILRPVRAVVPVTLAVVAFLWIAAPLSFAAQESGAQDDTGLIGLSLPLGARAIGRGRAVSATAGELHALPYNPAAILGLGQGAVTYSRFEAAADTDVNGNYIAGGVDTRWGTIAVQAIYLDYGSIIITETSPDPVGTIEISDWAIGLSYADRTYSDKLAYGATVKWLSTNLGPVDASGPAFDAGLVYAPRSSLPLTFGLALRNLGPDLEFGDAAEDQGDVRQESLPSRVRLGVDFRPETFPGLTSDYAVELGFDIESDLRELATSSQHAGASITIHRTVILRGGLLLLDNPYAPGNTSNRSTGGAIGVGIRFSGFEADLAREISVSELGDETHFAVGWRF
jgi:hypothetical protein